MIFIFICCVLLNVLLNVLIIVLVCSWGLFWAGFSAIGQFMFWNRDDDIARLVFGGSLNVLSLLLNQWLEKRRNS